MNEKFQPPRTAIRHAARPAQMRPLAGALLAVVACLLSPLSAQTTVIGISNPSFETPAPSVFPDYTVGATGWTRTNPTINSGTFAPGVTGTTPAPIDGVQVGYADGFGGLQQVLSDTFAAGQLYTFSAYVGFRSDEVNSAQGTGAITLGYFDSGVFTPLSTQATTVSRGNFNLVTGSYQPAVEAAGRPIALRLTSTASFQVIFDQAQLSFTPVPEPSIATCTLGLSALGFAWWVRRSRNRRA